jgi:SAM-dependent methyltransferase
MIDRILQAYNNSDYDFRAIAKPDDVFAHRFKDWVPYYRMKAAIAHVLQPETILEIGVRFGYSGAAFLHGAPRARYTGIDLDTDTFGGEKGAISWAHRILPADRSELVVADTQKLQRLPGGIYDLVHVDGQQDEAGTFHDLVLAVRQARYILVDGYFWTRENFTAANEFLWRFREDLEYYLVIPGYAGEMLIKVKAAAKSMAGDGPGLASPAIRDLYTAEYFLRDCGGWEFFEASRQQFLQDGRLRSMADLLFARPGRRVLDLGAGRGELTVLAALAGWAVTAVDYSPAAVEILRASLAAHPEAARRVECICADATTFEPAGTYDVVLAGDLIEHLNPGELEHLYARVARWLNPAGRFVVHTFPNRWFYDHAHRRRRAEAARIGSHLPANPRSRYELLMHINEQSPRVLRRSLQRHFPHVCLWFGSPSDPGGSLLRHCSPHELSDFRDLYAIASPEPIEVGPLQQLFRSEPLTDRDFFLTLIAAPGEAAASASFICRIRVENRSKSAYLVSRDPFPTHLSYRWQSADGTLLPDKGRRTLLAPALAPGCAQDYSMYVQAPSAAGEFRLTLSLVQEHQFWLCADRPGQCPVQSVQIT